MAAVFDPVVATYLAQASVLAKKVLGRVADKAAVSGWELTSILHTEPDEMQATLNDLRANQLLNSNGDGLEGIYSLTQTGYLSRDWF